ncbi:TonB-dependent receptor [Methylobacillus gramineus]|uniref:TonB-dependent receptor n=1 Tax=Methylobacillus gramineus TaxID=755169 RepID=UPI001CFFD114|nr:TonB-dependent receptor [Methylobacillus gramineus]MCB5185483.1 TonB-dependent receptor [Methylobacillus gramineus]
MKINYVLATSMLAIFSSGALAEDATLEEVQVQAAQEKPGLNLKKKNSTASRLGLTAQETPASVEILDAQTIRQRGDISIREAATRTTGITDISNPGSGQAFSSRGFTGNNAVAQAEDGIRLATGASTQTYPSDAWGYERIEVLRGPASVLFGDGAAGGIINSIRKQANRESSFEALLGAGTRGAYRAGVGGTGAIGEIGAFRIDASALGGNGFIDRGDYDSQKIMTSLLFTPTDHLRIGFTLDHANESPTANYGSPLVDGKIRHYLRKANYNIDNNKMEFTDTRARAKVEWDISPTAQIRNESYFFKSYREWRNLEVYDYNETTRLVDRTDYLNLRHDMKQYGNRVDFILSEDIFGHQNRFLIGWDSTHTDFRHSGSRNFSAVDSSLPLANFDPGTGFDPLQRNYDAQITQNAFYLENAWNATQDLKLIIGLRKDYIDTENKSLRADRPSSVQEFTPLTWRVGAVFNLTPDTVLYGQSSRGTDPIANLLGLSLVNSTYDLTRSRQAEIGIKQSLGNHKAEWTLAAYHIAKDDIITRDPSRPLNSIQGGSQSSRGIEFATTLYPVDHWRLDFNATLLNARFDELSEGNSGISRAGNTPENVPEKVANAWVYYQQTQWEAGIGARYIGKRYGNNANEVSMAGYTVYDASAAWHISKQLSLRANVRNLTDKFYSAYAYSDTQQTIGTPRQLELTAEFRY